MRLRWETKPNNNCRKDELQTSPPTTMSRRGGDRLYHGLSIRISRSGRGERRLYDGPGSQRDCSGLIMTVSILYYKIDNGDIETRRYTNPPNDGVPDSAVFTAIYGFSINALTITSKRLKSYEIS